MVWVVDHTNHRTDFQHLNQYWAESLEFLAREADIELSFIRGSYPKIEADPLITDSISKSDQTQKICNLMISGEIKDGDIFIFTDGWNFSVLPLAYMRKEFKLDIKLIGFWADSYFADSTNRWTRFYRDSDVEHDWAKHFEKGLMQTYEYNCYKTSDKYWQFKRRYRNLMKHQVTSITGLPFEYLWKEGQEVDAGKKENIVVFPFTISDEEFAIFEAMEADFPTWKFVSVLHNQYNRTVYRELLKKAKIVMSVNRSDSDYTIFFEAMCNKCHILIPDSAYYKKTFGDRYRYPIKHVETGIKHIKFLRNRFALQDIIQSTMDHYSENLDILEEDALKLKNEMFSNEPFLKILEHANRK